MYLAFCQSYTRMRNSVRGAWREPSSNKAMSNKFFQEPRRSLMEITSNPKTTRRLTSRRTSAAPHCQRPCAFWREFPCAKCGYPNVWTRMLRVEAPPRALPLARAIPVSGVIGIHGSGMALHLGTSRWLKRRDANFGAIDVVTYMVSLFPLLFHGIITKFGILCTAVLRARSVIAGLVPQKVQGEYTEHTDSTKATLCDRFERGGSGWWLHAPREWLASL